MTTPREPAMPAPLTVSVVIPAFNRAHTIGRAIESALAQTRRPAEVIVVDDRSTDGTREVLADWQRREPLVRAVCRVKNGGPAGARNAGVQAAHGDVIAFLDSDDVWLPEHLERSAGLLDADPGIDLAFADVRRVTTAGTVLHSSFLSGHKRVGRHLEPHPAGPGWFRFRVPETEVLYADYVVPVQTTVIRTAVARAFPFDERLRGPEDYQLALRLARAGKRFGYVDRVLGECLLHESNLVGDGADQRMCGEDIKLWTGLLNDPATRRRERRACHGHLSRLHHDRGHGFLRRGESGSAVRAYLYSLWHRPSARAARGLAKAAVSCVTGRRPQQGAK
jgi:glycosyltransferase involved in cell wall biosynthesis